MQKIIITLVLFISSSLFVVAQEQIHNLTVEITGMKSNTGTVFVSLYNKNSSFLKNGYKETIAKISNKKAIVTFKNIPKGIYAISVFHDENDNKKLDTRIFGIPKEPVGCSNGAVGHYGPPKYEDAKFNLDKDTTISVVVK